MCQRISDATPCEQGLDLGVFARAIRFQVHVDLEVESYKSERAGASTTRRKTCKDVVVASGALTVIVSARFSLSAHHT